MSFFMIILIILMLMIGGISVDVMRFETRRVAMQQTLDRAALAAASIAQKRSPKEIVTDWFAKASLGAGLDMVSFGAPIVTADSDPSFRRVKVEADVLSRNFFMGLLGVDQLQGQVSTKAEQAVSDIEIMLVLDLTWSMNDFAKAGDRKRKITALIDAATSFVEIVKANDKTGGVSIGMVPYATQVNIPANLREQFTVVNLSTWQGVKDQGVPNINCVEFELGSFASTALSQSLPLKMAAVAETGYLTTSSKYESVQTINPHNRMCTTWPDNTKTKFDEQLMNQVMLPSKEIKAIKERIAQFQATGNTSISLGMRWATALLDQAARPIYSKIGDDTVKGRPADNADATTRKIIILMTDGENYASLGNIYDAYKTGASPIWRGEDGKFAIRFSNDGPALNVGKRPACAGDRTFFVPHLQSEQACESSAWLEKPVWEKSGTVRQLDWSEVWHYMPVSWMVSQLYVRSNVEGTSKYYTLMGTFRGTYLTVPQLDSLLQKNCAAARDEGFEVYSVAFAAPPAGKAQLEGCASVPKVNYYFDAADSDSLLAAFQSIATDIADLRLTE